MNTFIRFSFIIVLACWQLPCLAAVILQYHHVSDTTPKSTSISVAQFSAHLDYLQENDFTVLPLSTIIDHIKNKRVIPDKTVAITFDDAYLNILTNAKPILDKYNYPYTIFVNANIINRQQKNYLSWQQLNTLAKQGVIIANHGFEHDSIARIPAEMSSSAWLKQQTDLLLKSEQIIQQHTGQSWRYFAYPYGEYTPEIQQWLTANNFVGFSQQSGAVGLNTDLSIVPRFPVSAPYDQLDSLYDKLNSLPLYMTVKPPYDATIFNQGEVSSITFDIDNQDINPVQMRCYVSGLGKQVLDWQGDKSFTLRLSSALPVGRVRCNCTAPSISKPGRYYWYSKPWFVLSANGQWYPL